VGQVAGNTGYLTSNCVNWTLRAQLIRGASEQVVIARSEATRQSRRAFQIKGLDCFAALAMTRVRTCSEVPQVLRFNPSQASVSAASLSLAGAHNLKPG
jgi:hypothetical protein